jgi:hypothetical protein
MCVFPQCRATCTQNCWIRSAGRPPWPTKALEPHRRRRPLGHRLQRRELRLCQRRHTRTRCRPIGSRILRVGFSHPFPEILTRRFLDGCEKVLVAEEGEPYLQEAVRNCAQRIWHDVADSRQGRGPFFQTLRIRPDDGEKGDRILFPSAVHAFGLHPGRRPARGSGQAAQPVSRLSSSGHLCGRAGGLRRRGHLPHRHRLLHAGAVAAFAHGRFSDRHGRRHRHRRRFCSGHGAQGGGIYRRLHLFPQRPVSLGQCGLQQPRFHGGRAGQRHHRHDRASAPSRRGSQPPEPQTRPGVHRSRGERPGRQKGAHGQPFQISENRRGHARIGPAPGGFGAHRPRAVSAVRTHFAPLSQTASVPGERRKVP